MKNLFFKFFYKFTISAGIGFFSFYGPVNIADEINNRDISKDSNFNLQLDNVLLKIPIGNFESASKRVKFNRNPFRDPIQSDFLKVSNINSILQFKGLVKSGDKLMAIIYTKDGQNLYQEGDDIGNGFLIKSISIQDTTVDISDGLKFYRLSLKSYKSQL